MIRPDFATLNLPFLSANVLYSGMEVEEIFANCIPLTAIAQQLGVGRDLFYRWVVSNGFTVTRIRGNRIAVTQETARAIVLEAKKQGFANPSVSENEESPDIPTGSDEKGTLAYRLAHPSFSCSDAPRWEKAKTSWQLGYKGDMQPIYG
jgi:hypothetical protein